MTEQLMPLSGLAALEWVHPRVFTARYFMECMKCTFCDDGCCQYGCDVNVGERDRIMAVKDQLQPYIDVPSERWFTTEEQVDAEYPTGKFVRANQENGKCVFRNPKGRGCGIHQFALDTGRDYHSIKPMVCWLFPVCWDKKVLRPNSDVDDDLICRGQGMTLYEGAREELRVVFGDVLIDQLDVHAATVKAAAASGS